MENQLNIFCKSKKLQKEYQNEGKRNFGDFSRMKKFRSNSSIKKISNLIILSILIIWISTIPAFAGHDKDESSDILTVDMPYNLFMALASYHELTETEADGENINKEIIPVIETIIDELTKEYKKCEELSESVEIKGQLRSVLVI